MAIKFTNNATSTLASTITSASLSLTVATGQGALFPTLSGDYFYCTLSNTANTIEIVKVTARSTDTFTIVRAQDNTTASAFVTGDKVELRLVSAVLSNMAILDQTNIFSAAQTVNINGTVGATTPAVATVTTLTATADSAFTSTGALNISKGTTGQRPTPTSGMLRFNTTSVEFEGYNGTAWAGVGGAALSNDTSTATNVYPLFAAATSGTASTLYTGNAKLLYKPSTGELQASVPVALNGLFVNATTLVSSYTIAAGQSAQSVGGTSGFTIPSSLSVTLSSGSRWVVL